MGSSFIKIREKGFWANDGFVEAMQLCLINEIEQKKLDSVAWLNGFKLELSLQSLPLINGGMSMQLEEFLTDFQRKETIIELIDSICDKIETYNDFLTGENLHRFRKRAMVLLKESRKIQLANESDFTESVNEAGWKDSAIHEVKERYLHSFKLLKSLIKGKLETGSSSPIDYWNY
ncbi:hypothetical protein [Nibribacter koreensis]|uniref:Uncharacterized protein n=1 Tax=Nibribacter koreensis TaxID=1084519 RepID=A0ABP8FGE0_9BACT